MRAIKHFMAVFVIVAILATSSYALVVYDPVNAMYNQIRNTLMEVYHVEDIKNVLDQLFALRTTFEEIKRFQSGIDEIRSLVIGDYKTVLNKFNPFGLDTMGFQLTDIQRGFYDLIHGSSSVISSDYRTQLNTIFGEDPQSITKPYITQEELAVADAYRWSREVRKNLETTMDAGNAISLDAQSASPKGSTRLAADALGKILVAQAQIQANQAKQIEIGATQIEQTSREEKYYERERLKFMDELNDVVSTLPGR